jgi:hypothetical protein
MRDGLAAAMEFLDGEPARTVGRRLGGWARRRPAVVAAGSVPLIAAVAVVALLPAAPAESAGAEAAPHASTGPASPIASPTPTATAASGSSVPGSDGMDAADPVIAAAAVMGARHACFEERPGTPACLARVLDAEPAFVAQETAALETPGAAAERDFTGASFSLIEGWGDAALIAVVPDAARTPKSEPASLLLVRNEAGWRLRAVYP